VSDVLPFNQDSPMAPYVQQWLDVLQVARRRKAGFDEDADEAMSFYSGSHDWMWEQGNVNGWYGGSDMPQPDFRMTINKTYEAVSIFGPGLYYQNPHRQVNPRRGVEMPIELFGDVYNDPQAAMAYEQYMMELQQTGAVDDARAKLLETYLNYTPNELRLKMHMRRMIDEAIIKGMGVLWTEITTRPDGSRMVGSFWENINNLLIDGDMDTIEDAQWVARRCIHPVWEVEEEYGLPRGTVKPNYESMTQQGRIKSVFGSESERSRGRTNDLVEYWKIYSKMGMGDLMGQQARGQFHEKMRGQLDDLGRNCYLVVAKGVPYPLNIPPWVQESENFDDVFMAVQWPTPYWLDNRWPFTPLRWRDTPGQLWPTGLIKPAIGELRAINWIASALMGKIRTTSRDFIVTLKQVDKELKRAINEGGDLTHLELESAVGDNINHAIQFLQHPEMNSDIYRCLELFMGFFDKRTGLLPQLYGESGRTQDRSATESRLKQSNIDIRRDDMAEMVEECATQVARAEAICARWHLTGEDVMPVLGKHGAMMWESLISQAPIGTILSETEYRIEAGSAKKPNKDRDADNMTQAMQTLSNTLTQYAFTTGDTNPLNELVRQWGIAMDMDVSGMLIPPLQLAPPEEEGEEEPAQTGE